MTGLGFLWNGMCGMYGAFSSFCISPLVQRRVLLQWATSRWKQSATLTLFSVIVSLSAPPSINVTNTLHLHNTSYTHYFKLKDEMEEHCLKLKVCLWPTHFRHGAESTNEPLNPRPYAHLACFVLYNGILGKHMPASHSPNLQHKVGYSYAFYFLHNDGQNLH